MMIYFILLLLPSFSLALGPDHYGVPDEILHSNASSAITTSAIYSFEKIGVSKSFAVTLSAAASLAVGYGKEKLIDKNYSRSDMRSNLFGIASGVCVFTVARF